MKIYTISHLESGYDYYYGHVIIAHTPNEVRQLAINKSACEGEEAWLDAPIEEIGEYNKEAQTPFILMSDFNAG